MAMVRQAWQSIAATPATWLCSALVVVPALVLPSRQDYAPIACCLFLPIWILIGIGLMGFIRIAAGHGPREPLPLRHVLLPGKDVSLRFLLLLAIQFGVILPFLMAAALTYAAFISTQAPVHPFPFAIVGVALLVPTVYLFAVLELAQREVLLARSKLTRALPAAWSQVRANPRLLSIAFGVALLVQLIPFWALRLVTQQILPLTSLTSPAQSNVLQAIGGLAYMATIPLASAIVTHVWLQLRPAGKHDLAPA